jgi:hypothetical protein
MSRVIAPPQSGQNGARSITLSIFSPQRPHDLIAPLMTSQLNASIWLPQSHRNNQICRSSFLRLIGHAVPLKSDLLLGLDWFVVVGHKWNDYRNVISEVYPKLFGARFARNVHCLVQFALSYPRWSTGHLPPRSHRFSRPPRCDGPSLT